MFITDFYWHAAKLIVELDGKIHLQQKAYYKERTKVMMELGINTIRFSILIMYHIN